MTTRVAVVAGLLLQLGAFASGGPRRLEGCLEAEGLASGLARLRERGWTVWTPPELAKAWPRRLTPLDCQSSQGTCVLLAHKGRGGEGSCECCETFEFEQDDARGKGRERLSAAIVYYSADGYAEVLAAASLLAKAMGLPDSEGPVGPGSPPREVLLRHFEWNEPSQEKRAVLDTQISHDQVWTVYLRVGWHPAQ